MIINIRGTSGSGKSTLVRALTRGLNAPNKVHVEGRKQPLYTTFEHPTDRHHPIAVLGHYETACGGCDTINGHDTTFDLVRKLYEQGYAVVFEGLLLSGEFRRTAQLHADGFPLHVAMIDLPVGICIDSVNQRRWAKNPDKPPVNPKNTEAKWKTTHSVCRRLKAEGVSIYFGDRQQVLDHVKQLLQLN